MSSSNPISKLNPSDKASFISLMSSAFAQDPIFLHIFGHSEFNEQARRHTAHFFSFLFDKSEWLHEEIWGYYENGKLLGAYIIEKPKTNKIRPMSIIRLVGRLISLAYRLPIRKIRQLNDYMRITRSMAPSTAHHYLIIIGVAPEAQGKGIGKALLQHLLHDVDSSPISHGVALDTENIHNIVLYEKFGFILMHEAHLDHVPIYGMFRPNQQNLTL
ncbi:GNAT family N-acetyltransferase [Paenibacillus arenosi]|uniref:GNAT family N-acetyltransferase n=1 Tax=Paenibacillus arenosi TaxID=2774142 RepID=A0ABR9ATU1_9BACL|nr:GNAT family N-acetyltransferase [Paenibacillus arenosi]MBD8497306.1 GNAT family N-acetyltransferase [Paenibacillus arenosi]